MFFPLCARPCMCVCTYANGHQNVKPVHKIGTVSPTITQTKETIGTYYNCICCTMSEMQAFNMAAECCFLDINKKPLVQSDLC